MADFTLQHRVAEDARNASFGAKYEVRRCYRVLGGIESFPIHSLPGKPEGARGEAFYGLYRERQGGCGQDHVADYGDVRTAFEAMFAAERGVAGPAPITLPPKVLFKVWVSVEEYDCDRDEGTDVGLPDELYVTESLEAAKAFVRRLPGWPEQGGTSDYREGEPA